MNVGEQGIRMVIMGAVKIAMVSITAPAVDHKDDAIGNVVVGDGI